MIKILLTYFSLLIVMLAPLCCNSQNEEIISKLKLADSTLIKHNPKVIVLYENDTVQVFTTRKFFIRSCKAWTEYTDTKLAYDFYKRIKSNVLKSAMIDINDYDLKSFVDDIFQSLLLEENKCIVYNKLTKRLEKKVSSQFYDLENNNQGFKYKTENNFLILKTEKYSCF